MYKKLRMSQTMQDYNRNSESDDLPFLQLQPTGSIVLKDLPPATNGSWIASEQTKEDKRGPTAPKKRSETPATPQTPRQVLGDRSANKTIGAMNLMTLLLSMADNQSIVQWVANSTGEYISKKYA